MNGYRYLIGYAHNNGQELARIDITVPAPIHSMTNLAAVEQALRANTGHPDAFVLSFSPFDHHPAFAEQPR